MVWKRTKQQTATVTSTAHLNLHSVTALGAGQTLKVNRLHREFCSVIDKDLLQPPALGGTRSRTHFPGHDSGVLRKALGHAPTRRVDKAD